jgi:pimeloyl-ACP methyl ester carboxylesterase
LPAPLQGLFNPAVQPFIRDLMAQDPPGLARSLKLPLLIVQGDQDLQVTVADARALAAAQPKAKLVIVSGVNHVLKVPGGEGRELNMAAYADPSLPIAPGVVDAVASFVKP